MTPPAQEQTRSKKKASAPLTKAALLKKIKALGTVDDATRNALVCALVGHSRIQHYCFGYFTCGRCDAQLGDSLGGVYDGTSVVIVGHDCEKCRANLASCTWRDTLFAAEPLRGSSRPDVDVSST